MKWNGTEFIQYRFFFTDTLKIVTPVEASKIGQLSPVWIEKIEILKDAKDTAVYGAKGANGVILIEIKKAYWKKIRFSK